MRLITEIRSARAELNVPAGAKITLLHDGASEVTVARLAAHAEPIRRLARIEAITPLDGALPEGAVQLVVDEANFVLPLADVIDVANEVVRLHQHVSKLEGEIAGIDKKLGNAAFTSRAPVHVVEEQRERRAETEARRARIAAALDRLEKVAQP